MEDFIAMTKKKKVTKAPIALINQNVTGEIDKEDGITTKKWNFPNILQGFNGSKKTKKEPVNPVEMDKENHGTAQTNQATKEPMAPTNLNVTKVHDDTENHGTAQTNQVIEKPVEMGKENHEKKEGIIKKLKVLISDKQHIPKLTKKLEEINGNPLKDKDGKIDKGIKGELRKYNITLENNTLLEVIHKNKEYNYNTTPLLLAVQSNLTEVAKTILSMTDANLHIQDNGGMNALHYAAKNNDKLTVQTLLQKKLQVNVEDKKGKTALHYAAENNCGSIVKALLQHGANINALDKDGRTSLFYALTKNYSTLANFMMTQGALLEIKDNYDGKYELLADASLETSDAITSGDEDPFGEQPTLVEITPANENHSDEQSITSSEDDDEQSIISNSESCGEELDEELELQESCLEEDKNPLIEIPPINKNPSEENLSSKQPTTVEVPQVNESPLGKNSHDQHPQIQLRRVTRTEFPPKPNEAKEEGEAQTQPFHDKTKNTKRTYKTVILVASAAAIITTSMLTYFTTLPTLAIIGIAFASALVFGSIATLNPMSKMYDTDCSKVCGSKNLFI